MKENRELESTTTEEDEEERKQELERTNMSLSVLCNPKKKDNDTGCLCGQQCVSEAECLVTPVRSSICKRLLLSRLPSALILHFNRQDFCPNSVSIHSIYILCPSISHLLSSSLSLSIYIYLICCLSLCSSLFSSSCLSLSPLSIYICLPCCLSRSPLISPLPLVLPLSLL